MDRINAVVAGTPSEVVKEVSHVAKCTTDPTKPSKFDGDQEKGHAVRATLTSSGD